MRAAVALTRSGAGLRGPDLEAAFRAHAHALCRAMHALTGDGQLAQEIVQDAFVFAIERQHELEDGPGLRCYLYRVAINRMRHRIRAHQRFLRRMERLFFEPRLKAPTPEDTTDALQHARRIHATIATIPLVYREAFVLHHIEGLSGAEIAAILDIPEATVWSRMSRARTVFRDSWTPPEAK